MLRTRRKDPKAPAKKSQGAALVEYAMVVGLVSVVSIAAVFRLGVNVDDTFTTASTTLEGKMEIAADTSLTGGAGAAQPEDEGAGVGPCGPDAALPAQIGEDLGCFAGPDAGEYHMFPLSVVTRVDYHTTAEGVCNRLNHGGYSDWYLGVTDDWRGMEASSLFPTSDYVWQPWEASGGSGLNIFQKRGNGFVRARNNRENYMSDYLPVVCLRDV